MKKFNIYQVVSIGISVISSLVSNQLVSAGTITKSEMADTPFQFVANIEHEAVINDELHVLIDDTPVEKSSNKRKSREWRLFTAVEEFDGQGKIEDSIEILISSTHLIPPASGTHDNDRKPNKNNLFWQLSIGMPEQYKVGSNSFTISDEEDHPENEHTDELTGEFNIVVDENKLDILSWEINVRGKHCNQCPIDDPNPDFFELKTLPIPEPSIFLGLISFGFLTLGSIRNKIKS